MAPWTILQASHRLFHWMNFIFPCLPENHTVSKISYSTLILPKPSPDFYFFKKQKGLLNIFHWVWQHWILRSPLIPPFLSYLPYKLKIAPKKQTPSVWQDQTRLSYLWLSVVVGILKCSRICKLVIWLV